MSKSAANHEPVDRTVLATLRGILPNLSRSEARVARTALDDPGGTAASTIAELARRCNTSETTVIRLCRTIGFNGYPEFRLALAAAAAATRNEEQLSGEILPDDTTEQIVRKVAGADARAITETAEQVSTRSLEEVARAIATARRIDIFGAGASSFAAQELQSKLHRIGLMSHSFADPQFAIASAGSLGSQDVAVGLSHSGSTKDTIRFLEAAAKRGATTVAITNHPRAPIARRADIVLTTAARETTFRSGAMASRIALLALVEIIFVLVAQQRVNTAITVNLKPGITWSDGTALTARDFVGLWDVKWAQQDPNWASLTDVKATSDTQLVYETRDLSPNLLQQLLRWHQPAPSSQFGDIYDRLGQLRASGASPADAKVRAVLDDLEALEVDQAVTYGPYVIDPSSVTTQQLRMIKNDGGYNADKISFDHVDVVWGRAEQTVPLLLRNELDYTTDAFTPADVRALEANPNLELIRTPLSTGTGIWFNESIRPFEDKRFRRAIALIIDRDRNAKAALGEAAKPVEYMVGFSDTYVDGWLSDEVVADLDTYHQDLEAAAGLLMEIGLSKDRDTWTYQGKPFGFEITAPSDFADFLASARDVSEQLNAFGFGTRVRGIPSANRPDTIAQARYEVMLDFSMVSTPSHPATSLNWNMARGHFGTNNPEASGSKGLNWPWHQRALDGTEVYIPDLLDQAVAGFNQERQKRAVEKLAQIFNDQLPVVPIFERYTTDPIAHGPRVTGWLPKDHPVYVYKNNQGSDNYVSIQFLEGILRPAEGSEGSFRTSAPYTQPPGYGLNMFAANSIHATMTSPSYDITLPPLFWYAAAIDAYIPAVGESYSVAKVDDSPT